MILTGEKLEEFGRALWPGNWVSRLAARLACSRRTVQRMRDTKGALPKELQRTLLEMCDHQIKELETRLVTIGEWRDRFSETFDDG